MGPSSSLEPSDHARSILPPQIPDWSVRIPALDGLRGIAILLVLSSHAIFEMQTHSKILADVIAAGKFTWSGVDLFFVLSGFLIGGILLDARKSPRYFQTFYIRRAYRIFPLYFLVIGVFLFHELPFHILPGHFGSSAPLPFPWWSYVTLTQNFWMAHQGAWGAPALGPTWSLTVEEQFYLTIPLLVWLIQPRQLRHVLLFVVLGAPLLRLLLRHILVHGDLADYVLMPCRADALCLGVLAAMLVRSPRGWNLLLTKRALLYAGTGILFAAVAFMTYRQYDQESLPVTTFGYSILAFFYTGCLLITVSKSSQSKLLCNPALMGLGTLAYCSYLLHIPLTHACRRLFELRLSEHRAWLPGGMLGIALTLTIAWLSWKFFEKPLVRHGHTYKY